MKNNTYVSCQTFNQKVTVSCLNSQPINCKDNNRPKHNASYQKLKSDALFIWHTFFMLEGRIWKNVMLNEVRIYQKAEFLRENKTV